MRKNSSSPASTMITINRSATISQKGGRVPSLTPSSNSMLQSKLTQKESKKWQLTNALQNNKLQVDYTDENNSKSSSKGVNEKKRVNSAKKPSCNINVTELAEKVSTSQKSAKSNNS